MALEEHTKIRMIIADDEPAALLFLQKAVDWDKLGIEIIAAVGNGEEAFRIIEQQHPDLALLDINMPGMTGLDIAERLQERYPGLVFALVTAYAEFSYAQAAVRYGAGEYLVKPFTPAQLESSVLRLKRILERNEGGAPREREEQPQRINWHAGRLRTETMAPKTAAIVRGVDAYVEAHYMESDMSVQDIARSLFLDVSYVRRIFSAAVGCSLVDYLTEYRMRKAEALLQKGDLTIAEISERVGYLDPGYFAKCFKRYFGYPPSRYGGDR